MKKIFTSVLTVASLLLATNAAQAITIYLTDATTLTAPKGGTYDLPPLDLSGYTNVMLSFEFQISGTSGTAVVKDNEGNTVVTTASYSSGSTWRTQSPIAVTASGEAVVLSFARTQTNYALPFRNVLITGTPIGGGGEDPEPEPGQDLPYNEASASGTAGAGWTTPALNLSNVSNVKLSFEFQITGSSGTVTVKDSEGNTVITTQSYSSGSSWRKVELQEIVAVGEAVTFTFTRSGSYALPLRNIVIEEATTSINDVFADIPIVSTTYYTISGVKIPQPTEAGAYIKQTLYEDGNVSASKVFITD